MEQTENLEQSWNKRSKKWVLIDTGKFGGIKDMQGEKFPGVPVRKGKPEPEPANPETLPEVRETKEEPGAAESHSPESSTSLKPEPNEQEQPEQKEEKKESGSWANFFGM